VIDLETLEGMPNSSAQGIWSYPTHDFCIVGTSFGGPGPSQATIWQTDGGMCLTVNNLNELVVNPNPLILRTATDCALESELHWLIVGTGTVDEVGRGGRPAGPHAYLLIQDSTTGVDELTLADQYPSCPAVEAIPSPFSVETLLSFELPTSGAARLSVHDILGRRIAILTEGTRGAGRYSLLWTGRDATGKPVPSGVYMVRLEFGEGTQTRKIVRVVP
jgi:hypothetical protein